MSLRIVNLKAENIKKLVAVDITPTDNTVVISGKNGAGKSSVLDAIFWALKGGKNIQDMPIREGEQKAVIQLDLGKLKVERRFTEKGTYLYVSTEDGARYQNPQEMLDKLIGAITFDPLEFSRLKPKEQYETVRQLVKLDTDVDALDKANDADFEERRLVNREVENLKAQVEGIVVPEDTPTERVNVTALIAERDALTRQRNEAADVARRMSNMVATRDANAETIEGLKRQIVTLEGTNAGIETELQALNDQWKEMPEPTEPEFDTINEQIASADQVNRAVDLAEQRAAKAASLAAKQAESERLTQAMDSRKEQKAKAIERADMPVAGLGFADGAVVYQGIPLDQCSSAEQLRISTAIAMSSNPELRVIRIKDGSLLDDEGMAAIRKMADDNDFQIWVERVGHDPMAIEIVDGQVAE